MLKIAIVEDEQSYVNQLKEYLDRFQKETDEIITVSIFHDGDEITSKYTARFDIILMDIQMKFVDGMTAAKEIRKMDSEVTIIFISNLAQYAIRGYEVDALDYIIKPVTYFAFSQKLSKAVARMQKRKNRFITVTVKGGVQRIDTSDIYYVESFGHNLIFHTKQQDYISGVTMKSAEELLANMNFSRGNKCYLINLEHVEGIQDNCAIINGEKLMLSRNKKVSFMQELTKYWGELK
ncbi:MAG: LytTR family DNA-binding domain-containing protein [Lachnospiraceae bacterium]|nr:LytTR family DNA-binding domain-containing protein [Lachnospiraceae bacterium]MDD3660991.1 LytTR family DNA-binding domain-containing protein [Lachnospiraceae bacterium]